MSRLDICARLAAWVSKIARPQVRSMYRVNDLFLTAKQRQGILILTFKSGLGVQNVLTFKPYWSGAAFGDRGKDGKRRLGFTVGLLPASPDVHAVFLTSPPVLRVAQ